ncbi:MAG: TolC family protein [Deltaproteobacteria bacterium]|nr:TolC family protein [Deltaproteobacteria bacterium]
MTTSWRPQVASGWLAFALLVAPPPATAAARLLTLDDALSAAKQDNPLLIAARANAAAAGYKVDEVRAGYLPQANVVASYARGTSNFTPRPGFSSFRLQLPPESMTSVDYYSAALNVSQTIYDFGKTGGVYDAAIADGEAAAADVKTTADGVYVATVAAYFAVLASQELLQAAHETERQMQRHLELAVAQTSAGVRPKIDVTRAKADVAGATLAVITADNRLAMAKSALNAVMGLSETTSDYRVERPPAPAALEPALIDGSLQAALAKRADHRSLRAKIDAMTGLTAAATAGYLPTLAASANVTYAGLEPKALVYNWGVGATLTWSFFSGLATKSAVDELGAHRLALEASLKNLEIGIRNEIETALLALHEATERRAPAAAMLGAATETLEMAEGRYQAGAGSIVEVTDAQALVTQARAAAIGADYDLEVARARLLKALGDVDWST